MQKQIIDLYYQAEHKAGDARQIYQVQSGFRKLMESNGFVCIGMGMYGTVWKRAGRVYRINSKYQGPYDGFYQWARVCMENPDNPALPDVSGLYQIGQRYCVEVSQMIPQVTILDATGLIRYAETNMHMREAIKLALKVAGLPDYYSNEQSILDEYLDIHTGNIMRKDCMYVLNDPIGSSDFQIPNFVSECYA